jgi:MFS family permease
MDTASPAAQPPARTSLFANRDFSLLFGGSSISAFGDQFTLVALPWLVLKLTGNPAALGIVLAVMAVPRAAFMLVGGAIVDRMSPRRVLLGARAVNAACIVILAALMLIGDIQMWMVYLLALGIGLSTAFAYPAGSAILPQLVKLAQLRAANAAFMGMRQLSMVVGPVLAGFVIALGANHPSAQSLQDARGLGLAFSVDAASFVSVFVGGPIQVGLPVLADTRLNLGAASLGILMTAQGVGMFAGSFLSGLGQKLVRGHLGVMVLCIDSVIGLTLAALMLAHTTYFGAALLFCTGLLGGMVQIAIFVWIQQRVSQQMMGRTMSILMFTFMGLGPLSAAAAGALLKVISLTALFGIAGLTLAVIALCCLSSPQMRSIRAMKPEGARA